MDTMPDDGLDRIAVVGLACRVPGAQDADGLWDSLLAGRESIVRLPVTGDEPDGYVPAAAPLEGPGDFDAEFFGMTPREAELTDPQQRLFLEHCWTALENAGCDPARYDGRIGVWGGCGVNTYLALNVLPHYRRSDLLREYPAALLHGNDKDYLATRTAYRLGLTGPAMSVQTACSTSLVAVAQACQSLLDFQCDMALAGGAALKLPQEWGYVHEDGGIQSPDGHCRPFDAGARGTVFGSGVGVVVLKRLEDALADGDTVHAVILGAAVNNDGARRVGYAAPSVDGQAEVIAEAYRAAGVGPESVGYVEAHGTGTPVGDPIELAALDEVFRAAGATSGSVLVGSVKSNLGHLNAASGVIGLIKATLAVRHGQVPPTVHYRTPNPRAATDSPFAVNGDTRPWPRPDGPRRAGVSSFGVGGTNVHVVVEEPPADGRTDGRRVREYQVLPVSARTPGALEQACRQLVTALHGATTADLPDIAHTLQRGRRAFGHRRAVVCHDRDDAVAALDTAPGRPVTEATGVAFLFPGQGSQYSGMAADLLRTEPAYAGEIGRCAQILRPVIGQDLRDLLTRAAEGAGPDPLIATELAQPALFAVEYSLARTLDTFGVRPGGMLGHSLGEWVAACLAGVFDLPDALRLVAARGRMMSRMAPGGMLAVQLGEDEALALERPGLVLAAVNAPRQCVLSGTHEAVAATADELDGCGVQTRILQTSHAFHSPALDPMLGPFAELVAQVPRREPAVPFVSGLTGTWVTGAQATDPGYWAEQARRPVRCADGLRTLSGAGNPVLLEVGPGHAMGRFAAQIAEPGTATAHTVRGARQSGSDSRFLLGAVARLWEHGVDVDWAAFAACEERRTVPLPTYPFQRRTHWAWPPEESPLLGADDRAGSPPSAAASAAATVETPASAPPRPEGVTARMSRLWSELLGVADIAPCDDFFVLGGDSLLATQLASRIHRIFGVRVPLDDLLDDPSLEHMAKLITALGGEAGPSSTDHTEGR